MGASNDQPRWPQPGDRVRFLGRNGYDFQLAEAMKTFEPGAVRTVKNCRVGDWEHSVEFEELPGQRWNGVMFELLSSEAQPISPSEASTGNFPPDAPLDHLSGEGSRESGE